MFRFSGDRHHARLFRQFMPAADKLGVTPAMGFNLESDFVVFDGNHLRARNESSGRRLKKGGASRIVVDQAEKPDIAGY
jgi:hypothetical protein